jgi:RimJ/RimL family protein N-acetyltransferase
MQDQKIKIRFAICDDSKSIFDWRNNKHSKAMFFEGESPTFKEHSRWFDNSLLNDNRNLYIGEINGKKIGVCRIDLNEAGLFSEVSINMNPEMRGRGLGRSFLSKCVEDYLAINKYDLVAKIKPKNRASLEIFRSVGFELMSRNEEVFVLQRPFKHLKFKTVDDTDAQTMFELLERRGYSISHKTMPTKSEHLEFVKSNPYRYWALVLEEDCLVGSYYIQNDNSIGLNLLYPEKILVRRIVDHIKRNFEPLREVKTKIPAYFYINVSYANEDLKKVLDGLGIVPIQISYKVV